MVTEIIMTENNSIAHSSADSIPLGSLRLEYQGKVIVYDVQLPMTIDWQDIQSVVEDTLGSQNLPCPFCRGIRSCNIHGLRVTTDEDCVTTDGDIVEHHYAAALLKCRICDSHFFCTLGLGSYSYTGRVNIYPPVISYEVSTLSKWSEAGVPERTCILYADACRAKEAGAIISAGGALRIVAERTAKEHLEEPDSKKTLGPLLEECDLPEGVKNVVRKTCNDILHDNPEAHQFTHKSLDALNSLVKIMIDEWYIRPFEREESIAQLNALGEQEESNDDNIH